MRGKKLIPDSRIMRAIAMSERSVPVGLTLGDLARALKAPKPTLAGRVRTLVAKGLLEKAFEGYVRSPAARTLFPDPIRGK